MSAQIYSSYWIGNAPRGYLIARVEIAPGLYAESERNPFTSGEWRWISLRLGNVDVPGSESKNLCEVRTEDCNGIAGEVASMLFEISRLFDAFRDVG